MIIVKTTNGDRFINDAETLQVSHVKDKAQVEVWPSRWGNQQQQPQYFVIEHVEAVIYTNAAQATQWKDEGSELEKLKAKYDEHMKWSGKLRDEYMKIMQERDELKERLAKLEPQPKDYENDLLRDTVYNEMERIAIAESDRLKRETGLGRIKSGNGIRFLNIAKSNNIETVGQLLAVGRARFEKFRFMGPKCIIELSQALENLYGIKQW
jgi:hypothetical protein